MCAGVGTERVWGPPATVLGQTTSWSNILLDINNTRSQSNKQIYRNYIKFKLQ